MSEIAIHIEHLTHNNTAYQIIETSTGRWIMSIKCWIIGKYIYAALNTRDDAIQWAHTYIDTVGPEPKEDC
jgi:hypothetical protein